MVNPESTPAEPTAPDDCPDLAPPDAEPCSFEPMASPSIAARAAISVPTHPRRRPRVGWDPHPEGWKWLRNFYYHNVWMEHQLTRTGVLRRFVIVDTEELRGVLRQPRRREIASLLARQPEYELRTSELWELADAEALPSLQDIYAGAQAELANARQAKQAQARPTPALGRLVRPTDWHQEARGILLHAEASGLFVWDPEQLKLLRIPGPGLEAIQESQVRAGETVLVVPDGRYTVPIEEERSGSHGTGHRTLHRSRQRLKVHRVESPSRPAERTQDAQWRRA
jgi:hypothetical protein